MVSSVGSGAIRSSDLVHRCVNILRPRKFRPLLGRRSELLFTSRHYCGLVWVHASRGQLLFEHFETLTLTKIIIFIYKI